MTFIETFLESLGHISCYHDNEPFTVLLNLVCKCFINDICVCSSGILASGFLVPCNGWLWNQDEAGSQYEFGTAPSSIFWKSVKRTGINSSLHGWYNSPVKSSGPRLYFVGNLLNY